MINKPAPPDLFIGSLMFRKTGVGLLSTLFLLGCDPATEPGPVDPAPEPGSERLEEGAALVTSGKPLPQVKFAVPPQLNMPKIRVAAANDATSGDQGSALESAGDEDLAELCGAGAVAGRPLVQPQEIAPDPSSRTLQTELVVRIKKRCVPIWDDGWEWKLRDLRTYGFPIDHNLPLDPSDPDDSNIAWSAPGPTLILHPGSSQNAQDGSRFKMKLHNYMPTQESYSECDEIPGENGPVDDPSYTAPNCFHGNNVTNFHFHGFHISPQEHQDYVLLSLFPAGAADVGHAVHSRGDSAIGSYEYDVPPLPWNQAPGTHWYHAHKHGATALQVLNGLVGTFEVQGDFDKQLDKIYDDKGQQLEDRLMVVQQLEEKLPGLGGSKAKYPLVNGQAAPVVKMKPGQVQRWRFVGATMQASAKLRVGFEEEANGDQEDPLVRQIAMDGIQFAPENYHCQTLINGPDCTDTNDLHPGDFDLDPGNRIDLLVKAPSTPGTYHMTHALIAELKDTELETIANRTAALTAATGTTEPPLLTLVVEKGDDLKMEFPTVEEFPRLPSYLQDLPVPTAPATDIVYQMNDKQFTFDQVAFAINDKQYDPSCINESFVLGQPKDWLLQNNSAIAHPFHIHTNPFQVISELSYDKDGNPQEVTYDPPYVWHDTLAIPVVSTKDADNYGKALIRYEAVDFTGEFVNHCHILGHEDRGMMQNVQATCENGNWGIPTMDGTPECASPVVAPPPSCL